MAKSEAYNEALKEMENAIIDAEIVEEGNLPPEHEVFDAETIRGTRRGRAKAAASTGASKVKRPVANIMIAIIDRLGKLAGVVFNSTTWRVLKTVAQIMALAAVGAVLGGAIGFGVGALLSAAFGIHAVVGIIATWWLAVVAFRLLYVMTRSNSFA